MKDFEKLKKIYVRSPCLSLMFDVFIQLYSVFGLARS